MPSFIWIGRCTHFAPQIEFLTLYSSPGDTVLYAGAAPGSHVVFMAEQLFPALRFVLVDPAGFYCKPTPQVEIRQTYFTTAIAREFSGRRDVLFISDIRTANHCKQERLAVEEYVIQDNDAQKEWVKVLRPKKAMLKLRLPYPDRVGGTTTYFEGEVFLPVWGRQRTTECRLVPDDSLVCICATVFSLSLCVPLSLSLSLSLHEEVILGRLP